MLASVILKLFYLSITPGNERKEYDNVQWFYIISEYSKGLGDVFNTDSIWLVACCNICPTNFMQTLFITIIIIIIIIIIMMMTMMIIIIYLIHLFIAKWMSRFSNVFCNFEFWA